MLSDAVLEDLVRNTDLRKHLIAEAWPNLSVESRLQVLHAVAIHGMQSIPPWLSLLAAGDTEPIVRYWAARFTDFQPPLKPTSLPRAAHLQPTEEDEALHFLATNDQSPLVRASVEKGNLSFAQELTRLPQRDRLVFIRNQATPSLGSFMTWLDAALDAGVPDSELASCCVEFFSLPDVKRSLQRTRADFPDPVDAYDSGKAIETGWRVMKKAGPSKLVSSMVYVLPTSLGLGAVSVEDLCAMPAQVLKALPYRTDKSAEILQVLDLMCQHPERFPEEAVKSLSRFDDRYLELPRGAALTEQHALQAVNRSESILETLLSLQRAVTQLTEHVQELRAAAGRKRGIFG